MKDGDRVDLKEESARETHDDIQAFIGLFAGRVTRQKSLDRLQNAAEVSWAGVLLQDCGEPVRTL